MQNVQYSLLSRVSLVKIGSPFHYKPGAGFGQCLAVPPRLCKNPALNGDEAEREDGGRDTCRRCFCGSSALSFRPNRNTEVHERNEEDNCNVPYARCSQTIKQTNYSRNGSALKLLSNGGARNLIWPKINLSLSLTARLPSRHVPPGGRGAWGGMRGTPHRFPPLRLLPT